MENKFKQKDKVTQDVLIEFAKFLVSELEIKLYNNTLYFKDSVKYSSDEIKLKRLMTEYLKLSSRQDNEVISQLYKYADYLEDNTIFKVKLRNGYINGCDVINKDFGFTPFYLDVEYNPKAYNQDVDKFLNFICNNDKDMHLVIEEILGHCLLINNFPHKIFFLVGNGANGKSTFLEMINAFCGRLASHIDIANFNDGTSLVSLKDKLVNISDDVDAIYLEKSKTLKTLASGNTISDREIYGKPVEIKNTATLIFTANELPVFKDKTNGLIRRLVIIPFNNIVKEIIPNLSELLSTDSAKSYLLNLGLNGIKRIYDNNLELSKCETINQATMQYHLDTDSVRAFINERPKIINVPIRDVYDNYVKFTQSCNKQIVSSNVFSRRLNALGFTSKPTNINGKTTRVFIVKRSN